MLSKRPVESTPDTYTIDPSFVTSRVRFASDSDAPGAGIPTERKIGILRDAARPRWPQTGPGMVVATGAVRGLARVADRPAASSGRTAEASAAVATDLGIGVLFDRLLDAVVIAHLRTGRIVLWNPAAEKLFGYSAEEVIGASV